MLLLLFSVLFNVSLSFCQDKVSNDFSSFYRLQKHFKTLYLKEKTSDSLKTYGYDKETRMLIRFESLDLKERTHSRYFYKDGELVYVILINDKLSNTPSIYHFDKGN
jgi:hypothetical protein